MCLAEEEALRVKKPLPPTNGILFGTQFSIKFYSRCITACNVVSAISDTLSPSHPRLLVPILQDITISKEEKMIDPMQQVAQ